MNVSSVYATAGARPPEVLVEEYAPMVKRIGVHLLGRLPAGIELDDLIQVGLVALLDAARHYEASKGASFQTYAGIRVRGAMLDEVRSNDWAPRSVYRKQRELTAAVRNVENRKGEHASATEIAKELGVSLEDYFKMLSSTSASRMLSLDQSGSDDEPLANRIQENHADPVANLESQEFRQEIMDAIQSLPEREALVMSLYYDKELNLKEIGEVLGVSESRVCQLHGQALVRLRAQLQKSISEHVESIQG